MSVDEGYPNPDVGQLLRKIPRPQAIFRPPIDQYDAGIVYTLYDVWCQYGVPHKRVFFVGASSEACLPTPGGLFIVS